MQKGKVKKGKSGAAAFYIVAFSTLILTVVAVGFAAVIISEIARSSNDDLAQSAFDSALAGVEDAKLAFYNYQSCIEKGATAVAPVAGTQLNCNEIVYYVENPDCDMVSHILGRVEKDESGEVIVEESSIESNKNNMEQAYTCVKINTSLTDYRGSLNSGNSSRVVKVKLDGVAADSIAKARISWYSNDGLSELRYNNFYSANESNKGVVFRSSTNIAVPPTLSIQLIQTNTTFNMSDFDSVSSGRTNRGTLTLVPADNATYAAGSRNDNYVGAYDVTANDNLISASQIVASNDKTVKNLPYAVYCDPYGGGEFVCSALLTLPKPIGGVRNDDTFMFVVSIPYGQPDTDFSLEFFCADDVETCGELAEGTGETAETVNHAQAKLKGVQIGIDSTGRANDLYRRVETRMDTADSGFPYPLYALQLLGTGNESLISKNLVTTKEWGL